MVLDGEFQAFAHVVIAGPVEGVADAGVIDQQAAEARLEIDIAGHVADQCVEMVVLHDHGWRIARHAGRAEPLLRVPQLTKLFRPEILHGKAADRGVDHRGDQKEMPQRLVIHRNDARTAISADVDIAFTLQTAENFPDGGA
ncbi:hypothetical protein D3C78_1512770 [compost metagenome]